MKSKFYHLFFGKKRFQKLFERIYMFCMSGMYYGHGGDFETSGELWVLDFIKLKLKNIETLSFKNETFQHQTASQKAIDNISFDALSNC